MLANPINSEAALQENVAIASRFMKDEQGRLTSFALRIEEAEQIGTLLWEMGYRLTEKS